VLIKSPIVFVEPPIVLIEPLIVARQMFSDLVKTTLDRRSEVE
jgi:hypothetical protein